MASIALASVLLAFLILFSFHISSVIEIPWANAMDPSPTVLSVHEMPT
jgi:hypothetical protein